MIVRSLGHAVAAFAVSLLAGVPPAGPGGPGQTTLHFPDNTVTLRWLGAKKASATFAGMNPQDLDVTTAGGMTRFLLEGKPYFWVSDRRAAELELQSLR